MERVRKKGPKGRKGGTAQFKETTENIYAKQHNPTTATSYTHTHTHTLKDGKRH